MSTSETSAPLPDLRFDVVDLIGRPGTQRRVTRTITVPSFDSPPAAMWPEAGSSLTVDESLESVVEGIYASGTASAHLVGECSRCLDPLEDDASVRIDELFTYPEKVPSGLSAEEREDILQLDGDQVDLGPLVYDALVLDSPATPLCREDCAGLCAQCGERLDNDPDHHHDVIDDRFAALAGFFGSDDDGDAAESDGTAPGSGDGR